jgi:hypothetical protein
MFISQTLDLMATSSPCFVQRLQCFSAIEEEGAHNQESVPREVTVFMYKHPVVNRASIVFLHCESSSKCIILRTSLHATILHPRALKMPIWAVIPHRPARPTSTPQPLHQFQAQLPRFERQRLRHPSSLPPPTGTLPTQWPKFPLVCEAPTPQTQALIVLTRVRSSRRRNRIPQGRLRGTGPPTQMHTCMRTH